MLKRISPHLTYTNAMVTLLAFVVLGGGAWAAATIGANDIKDNAIRSRHIKDGQVEVADLASDARGARAVALIDPGTSPQFNTNLAKRGFRSVTRAAVGRYCLTPKAGLDPSKDPAVVEGEAGLSPSGILLVDWDTTAVDCNAGRYEVRTATGSGVASDAVEFVIVVP